MRAVLVLCLLVLAACDSRTLVVESDTSWDGGIFGPQGSTWVEGTGDRRFPLGNGRHCWAFNARGSGTVRVFVESSGVTGTDATADEGVAVDGCTG